MGECRVVEWDVVDEVGRVGAWLVCEGCVGGGVVVAPLSHDTPGVTIGCVSCGGEGRVHRPYGLWDPVDDRLVSVNVLFPNETVITLMRLAVEL